MSEMVERVARAMCRDLGIPPDNWSEEDGVRTYAWQREASTARAAIEAMREPTAAMVAATKPAFQEVNDLIAFSHARGSHRGGIKKDPIPEAWRAMIDQALAP